jgi:hypothetical protein
VALRGVKVQIINLDYVVRIQPTDQNTSSIMMTDGIHSGSIIVQGNPGQLASAHRLRGS